MIRLFVGLGLPPDLARTIAVLGGGIPGANWVPEENLHVTLRFIGEVDEGEAETLHEALEFIREPAFTVTLSGLGTYGRGRRMQTLWVGVVPNPPLMHLQAKIESALVRAGLEPEGRKFTPHVSIAKLHDARGGRAQDFLAGNNLFAGSFEVDRFVLYSSQLGHGDPVYTAEVEYPLIHSVIPANAE